MSEETKTSAPISSPEEPIRSQEGRLDEQSTLQSVGLVAGVLGITAIIFAVALYALDPDIWPLAIGNAVFGALAIVLYFATNMKTVTRAMGGRSAALVLFEVFTVVGVLALLATLNYFAATQKKAWDLTKDGLFSLHERSRNAAVDLEKPVKIIGFFRKDDPVRESLKQAVELYQLETTKIELIFEDANNPDPELMKRFAMSSKSPPIVVVAEGGTYTKLGTPTEQAMTNALIKVGREGERKAYFMTGHGEPSIKDQLDEGFGRVAATLRDEGFKVEELSLINSESIPKDASVVVVAGAQSKLFPHEVEALRVWLGRGGDAIFLLEPGLDYGIEEIFRRHGIRTAEDMVIVPSGANRGLEFGRDAAIIKDFEPHAITNRIKNTAIVLYRARSVHPRLGLANLKMTTLVQTDKLSWGETAFGPDSPAPVLDENDTAGPVPVALASEKRTAGLPGKFADESRIVVVGDYHFATNKFQTVSGNRLFFLFSANWAIGDERIIAIPPPVRGGTRLTVTEREHYGIMFFSVNLLPLLIVGFGFSVWAIRRRK